MIGSASVITTHVNKDCAQLYSDLLLGDITPAAQPFVVDGTAGGRFERGVITWIAESVPGAAAEGVSLRDIITIATCWCGAC